MKVLIIYYSLTGHVKNFAQKLRDATHADLLKVETTSKLQYKGPLKYILGGFQSITGYNPSIKTINTNFEAYDHFIFITPIWASSYVPALNTLLDQYDFSHKHITLISSSKANDHKAYEKLNQKLPLSKLKGHYQIIDKKPEEQSTVINQIIKNLEKEI